MSDFNPHNKSNDPLYPQNQDMSNLKARNAQLVDLLAQWAEQFKTYDDPALVQFFPPNTVERVRKTRKALANTTEGE